VGSQGALVLLGHALGWGPSAYLAQPEGTDAQMMSVCVCAATGCVRVAERDRERERESELVRAPRVVPPVSFPSKAPSPFSPTKPTTNTRCNQSTKSVARHATVAHPITEPSASFARV
jgi:hypothetical protein